MDTVLKLTNDFEGASGNRSMAFARSGRSAGIAGGNDEYSDGFDIEISDSSLAKNPGIFRFSAFVHAPSNSRDSRIVVSFHRSDSTYSWYEWPFRELVTNQAGWQEITVWTYLPGDIRPGDRIKCFVWNREVEPVFIDDMQALVVSFHKR